MSVYMSRGKWGIKWFQKKASTAFSANSFVDATASSTGTVQPATSGTTKIIGICLKKIASTDSDYAAKTKIPVAVPLSSESECIADVTGTLTVAMETEDFDLSTDLLVDQAATTQNVVRLVQFISATKGVFTINTPLFP